MPRPGVPALDEVAAESCPTRPRRCSGRPRCSGLSSGTNAMNVLGLLVVVARAAEHELRWAREAAWANMRSSSCARRPGRRRGGRGIRPGRAAAGRARRGRRRRSSEPRGAGRARRSLARRRARRGRSRCPMTAARGGDEHRLALGARREGVFRHVGVDEVFGEERVAAVRGALDEALRGGEQRDDGVEVAVGLVGERCRCRATASPSPSARPAALPEPPEQLLDGARRRERCVSPSAQVAPSARRRGAAGAVVDRGEAAGDARAPRRAARRLVRLPSPASSCWRSASRRRRRVIGSRPPERAAEQLDGGARRRGGLRPRVTSSARRAARAAAFVAKRPLGARRPGWAPRARRGPWTAPERARRCAR